MKSAEFTDFASAAAFIAAGRKKGERATADGWNTVLFERGPNFVLELQGTPIVEYSAVATTIKIPMRNHVVADRIQRYGLADKFQLTTVGTKWSLSQAWGTMVGIDADPTIWLPVVNEIPAEITIDSTGTLVTPITPPMPAILTPLHRTQVWDPAIKKWLGKTMKQIDAGWEFTPADWKRCPQCAPTDAIGGQMLGWGASHTHLLSHMLEGVVLPATVVGLVAASSGNPRTIGLTISPLGDGRMGGSDVNYNHDATRRHLKSTLRYITR